MELQLSGQTALVTGSTSGIGKAIASSLAAEGAKVLINGRREDKVHETIEEIPGRHTGAELVPASRRSGNGTRLPHHDGTDIRMSISW